LETAEKAYQQVAAQSRRDELILQHLSLVRHVIGRLLAELPPGMDVENLKSAGTLGLVEAANKFDPTRGVEFKAYAYTRVRGAVLDELRRNCPLPQDVLQRVAKVRKAHEELPPPVTVEQLAEITGLGHDEVVDCLAAMRMTRVLSWEASGQIHHARLDDSHDEPHSVLEQAEQKQLLTEAITSLPERERRVVTLYYMEDLRLKEIGQVLKLSESRVSRLLNAALFQLGERLRAKERS
jgi:RNA polymerase sigma factor for flagellar operon FliA